MTDFVHLHLHTEYSLLDGACRINRRSKKEAHAALFSRALELGQKAVAITDHGNMFGVVDFYKGAINAGLKPIIGCEVYVAPRTRFDKMHAHDADNSHLILLAKDLEGYHNLMKIVSYANTEGFYIKPRCDMELLKRYSKGLIALSACLAGELPKLILAGDYEGAVNRARQYRDVFHEDYYIEIQDHGLEDQKRANIGLIRLARELEIPLAATNDVHYINKEDAKAQQVLMCIQTGKSIDDDDKMDFGSEEFYLKSGDEMAELFKAAPEAIQNTVSIADKCNLELEFHKLSLPSYVPPEGTPEEYLHKLCEQGFAARYGGSAPEGAHDRMLFELDTISKMGFVDYFLIVWDFINFAKSSGIPVGPGRGSAAGSIVSYCLRITDIDPLSMGLLFERFLNPERISMPDIDIDFCFERRQEVIDYVVSKYGEDHVAQIVTFGTMLAKGAIRDVGRALNMPYAQVDSVAKLVPFELKITIDDALEKVADLRQMYNSDPSIKRLLDMARCLEGMPRHSSIHAAGVVITGKPVCELVPLLRNENFAVTQYTMGTLEELGLLKMDFLGLRNLTVIASAERMIRENGGSIDVSALGYDDPKVYDMLSQGMTAGVFQLESGGMKNVLVNLRPKSIEDIIAVISLFRPGPMESIPRYIDSMHNPSHVRYKHPLLENILKVTYGCLVYQEQVMQIVRELAGYSYGRADLVRRAMSKKKEDEMQKERKVFIYGSDGSDGSLAVDGAVKRGVPAEVASQIFDEMSAFANYAFNKSHAAAYAVVAYRTAYLKAHYPREYMAALLTSVLDTPAKVSEYIAESQRMGIKVLPPHINKSGVGFTVEGDNIRFGLVAIKNIGYGIINNCIEERKQQGDFKDFYDFLLRMSGKDFNKKAAEGLILSGALDCFGLYRSQMLSVYERITDTIQSEKRRNIEGQLDLFGGEEAAQSDIVYPDIPEIPLKEKLSLERDSTGLYLSGHPLSAYKDQLEKKKTVSVSRILGSFGEGGTGEISDGDMVLIGAVIAAKRLKTTKSESVMAFVMLEDLTGSIEALVFPKVLTGHADTLVPEQAVIAKGRISAKEDEEPKFILESAVPLTKNDEQKKTQKKLYLKLPGKDHKLTEDALAAADVFHGDTPLILYFEDAGNYLAAPERMNVEPAEVLISRLKELIGSDNVVLK